MFTELRFTQAFSCFLTFEDFTPQQLLGPKEHPGPSSSVAWMLPHNYSSSATHSPVTSARAASPFPKAKFTLPHDFRAPCTPTPTAASSARPLLTLLSSERQTAGQSQNPPCQPPRGFAFYCCVEKLLLLLVLTPGAGQTRRAGERAPGGPAAAA